MSRIAIFGTGGAGREVAQWALECGHEDITLTIDDDYFTDTEINGFSVIPFSQIAIEDYVWIVAVADTLLREVIVKKIENTAKFETLIHPTAKVQLGSKIGEGVIIGPGTVISINSKIGKHSFVNGQVIIGHDCNINEYVTIAPRAVVLGNCKVEAHVFLGANSSIREKTTISSGTVVGMGSVVVTDLSNGIYVGNPARKIRGK